MPAIRDIATVGERGELDVHFHPGQLKAWDSNKRFILVLSGLQGGKTSFGPYWLLREIQRCGPGDYLIAAPTYTLLNLKLLPEFRKLFEKRIRLGKYVSSPSKIFTVNGEGELFLFGGEQEQPTRVLFGHAQDPDSLESATVKAAWLDEAGQKKFKLGSWEAIQGRLSLAADEWQYPDGYWDLPKEEQTGVFGSIKQGRVLVTTTAYVLGWLKNELYDPGIAGDPDVEVVSFESTMNPAFSRDEFERMRGKLPPWKFDMRYRGRFSRPAGMIYGSFEKPEHVAPAFGIPDSWPRFVGLDFGGVNTAAVLIAREPETGDYFLYRTYHEGDRTAAQHAEALKMGEPAKLYAVGGSKSEGQWRREFRSGGLTVHEPDVKEVEVGIDRVYGMFAKKAETPNLYIMSDQKQIISDIEQYSRVLDDKGDPTTEIEDKDSWHLLDALRYICTYLNKPGAGGAIGGNWTL